MNIWYFGGYRATLHDVTAWQTSLMQKLPGHQVTAFPYPENATAGAPLDDWPEGKSKELARDIAASGNSIIVGHSSGCAIANDVAGELLRLGCNAFKLIALDGFCPSTALLSLPSTEVWSASCGNIHSLNYTNCAVKAGGKFHVYYAKVRSRWPLHFSLVNLKVSDQRPNLTDGYYACDANTEVLGL